MHTRDPRSPLEATIHPDPYPYYARLAAQPGLIRDDASGLWLAANAATVEAVFRHPAGRVRPECEPVPAVLTGSAAGTFFGNHVRFSDGDRHARLRSAVVAAIGRADPAQVASIADRFAALLWRQGAGGDLMRDVALPLPVYVTAALIGLADAELSEIAALMADFAVCLTVAGPPARIAAGKQAAERLAAIVTRAAGQCRDRPGDDPLSALVAGLAAAGFDPVAVATANGMGLMAQSYEATAGLIGNGLIALAADPALRRRLASDAAALGRFVEEVLRCDPPTHNTRRFFAADARIGETTVRAGEVVLLLLAAANRDPALNASPERFDIDRPNIRHATFGFGPRDCPGMAIARATAAAALRQTCIAPDFALRMPVRYRDAANVRVPAALSLAPG